MKKAVIIFVTMAIVWGCSSPMNEGQVREIVKSEIEARHENMSEGVFIHLSQGVENPQRVLMALRMAEMMSEGRQVIVYFDINAVEVVLKDAPNIQFKDFPDAQTQLSKLIAAKVPLYVCPGCLAAAGHEQTDVRDGVEIANKDAFFAFDHGNILTLDY